jgi:hypothetical protein
VVEPTGEVATVWAAYLAVAPRSACTADRAALIRKWLDVYPASELVRSIRGYGMSPHHNGQNDRGAKYLSLELFLRDAKHVEDGWSYLAAGPPTPRPGKPRAYSNAETWAGRGTASESSVPPDWNLNDDALFADAPGVP